MAEIRLENTDSEEIFGQFLHVHPKTDWKFLRNSNLNEIRQWFSPDPPVSSTNKTDRHDIAEILLKVALNTIKQTVNIVLMIIYCCMRGHN
jgi:hypothetical protein